ncbi:MULTISPECIES: hypothetical protein [unclassified Streptomyces]|nr:hypothetical protein [Streptomyces sp. NBC_01477]
MAQTDLFSDPVRPEPVQYETPEPSADPFRVPDRPAGGAAAAPSSEGAPA